MHIASDRLK